MIVTPLPGVQIVGSYHSDVVAALCYDHGKQTAGVGFAIVDEPALPFDILFANRNGIVPQRLFSLLLVDLVRPDFSQVAPVPLKHRLLHCICNA